MTTGQRIKAARKKAGMTQADLAKKLGISYVNISQLEKDQRNPKLETLQRIAAALGISIYELIDGDDLKRAVIYGEGLGGDSSGSLPKLIEEDGPISTPEVEVHEVTAEELETLMAKLQDGKPLLLSPEELAKLKGTPKERVAAALDKQGEVEEPKRLKHLKAPIYKMAGVSPEQQEQLKALAAQAERAMGQTGRVARFNRKFSINAPQRRIAAALDKLNEEGQEKAAERVEELTEIPRYQAPQMLQAEKHVYGPHEAYTVICPICGRTLTANERTGTAYCLNCEKSFPFTTASEYQAQEPPTAPPQDPPAPQEGTDTTSPADGPEGRITSITMVCPICGMRLRGDPTTGKAHCHYCNRTFPLPASRSRNK